MPISFRHVRKRPCQVDQQKVGLPAVARRVKPHVVPTVELCAEGWRQILHLIVCVEELVKVNVIRHANLHAWGRQEEDNEDNKD